MSEFLYLFRGGDARQAAGSPERMQEHMGKWMKWMEDLSKAGKMTGGLPLKGEGKTVNSRGVITDGPYAEGKEVVGGYMTIKAASMDEALQISKDCPIFEFDGTVEVREIQSMDM